VRCEIPHDHRSTDAGDGSVIDGPPVVFGHGDDGQVWVFATEPEIDGWLMVRTDLDRPTLLQAEPFTAEEDSASRDVLPGWPVLMTGDTTATLQLYVPGSPMPWTIVADRGQPPQLLPPGVSFSGQPLAPGPGGDILPRDLTEVLSWRLAAELARRHPHELWIAHTVPITGVTYDCLTLWRPGDRGEIGPPIFQLNRGGSIHVKHRFDGTSFEDGWPMWSWDEYLHADPYRFVRELEDAAGLPPVGQVPTTTPRTLVWRLIAALVSSASRSVHRIEAVPGYADVAGYEGPNDGAFLPFQGARAALATSEPDDPLGTAHRRFWFVEVDGEPRVALSTSGTAWLLGDVELDLMEEYDQADRRLGPVIALLIGDVID
jgi:hypothetical protein